MTDSLCDLFVSATQLLKQDHMVIKKVLAALKASLDTGEPPVEMVRDVVTFSQTFVDRCHHGKEEACLFPCLQAKGIPKEGGPIGVMLTEHEMGRSLVKQIDESVKSYKEGKGRKEEIRQLCSEYVNLLEQHIFKEDNILFQMGDRVMQDEDQEETIECYEKTESEKIGEETHRKMLELAEKIYQKADKQNT